MGRAGSCDVVRERDLPRKKTKYLGINAVDVIGKTDVDSSKGIESLINMGVNSTSAIPSLATM